MKLKKRYLERGRVGLKDKDMMDTGIAMYLVGVNISVALIIIAMGTWLVMLPPPLNSLVILFVILLYYGMQNVDRAVDVDIQSFGDWHESRIRREYVEERNLMKFQKELYEVEDDE